MSLPEWLRFAELSLLAGWLACRAYRPRLQIAGEAFLPGLAALLGVAQLLLEAQAATDPFTSLVQVLPSLLASAYGGLSLAAVVLGFAASAWQFPRPSAALGTALASVLIVLAGASSVNSAEAVSAAASSGEIVMSPTLVVPRSAVTTPNPYANDPDSVTRGRAVYQQYCLACHGLNGDGNGPAVAGLRVRPPTFHNPQHFLAPGMDGAHYWVIQHGDGVQSGMPAWDGTLTPQQTWDVLDYVKSIAAATR